MTSKLVEVSNIKKYYSSGLFQENLTRAVDGVSFIIDQGETLALIGESGCGKSTLGKCILRLIEPSSGNIYFEGKDILELNQRQLRRRRPAMQMIFQDADGSLNPRMKVRQLLLEPLRANRMVNGNVHEQLAEIMDMVKLTPELLDRYPHEISGGQRQRAVIARALALKPRLIIADEPAASLDILIQAQILQMMKGLQANFNISYLFISHNINTVAYIADRIAVMYAGKIVELASKMQLLEQAVHPYTRMLLAASDLTASTFDNTSTIINNEINSALIPSAGCLFSHRCPRTQRICIERAPKEAMIENGHSAACHFAG